MRELRDILETYEGHRIRKGRAVLATVVKAGGSTYRRPGARMLLLEEGPSVGLVHGGCAETDLRERAEAVLKSGRPALATYDATAPDDVVLGLGLGCRGRVEVLFEPLPGPAEGGLLFLGECARVRARGASVLVFRASDEARAAAGDRLLLAPGGRVLSAPSDPGLAPALLDCANQALSEGRTFVRTLCPGGVELEVLCEATPIPPALALFGAGADAVPLARLAHEMGWVVRVADPRPAYADARRFPWAKVFLGEPEETAREMGLDGRTAVVLMAHHLHRDARALAAALESPAPYVALLGPAARREEVLAHLAKSGLAVASPARERIYGPAGLDLGGDSPEDAALAILGEAQAVLSGRRGGFLRERAGPIHEA